MGHHPFTDISPPLNLALTLATALGLAACGNESGPSGMIQCSEHETYSYFTMETYAQICDPGWTECNTCPQDSYCAAGLVTGRAKDSNSAGSVDGYGTCAIQCTNDADCAGVNFAAVNDKYTDSETWTCSASGVCRGDLVYEATGPSACQQCRNTCAGQGSWCQCDDVCG